MVECIHGMQLLMFVNYTQIDGISLQMLNGYSCHYILILRLNIKASIIQKAIQQVVNSSLLEQLKNKMDYGIVQMVVQPMKLDLLLFRVGIVGVMENSTILESMLLGGLPQKSLLKQLGADQLIKMVHQFISTIVLKVLDFMFVVLRTNNHINNNSRQLHKRLYANQLGSFCYPITAQEY